MVAWHNNGVTSPHEGVFVVAWEADDGSDCQVVSTYSALPENNYRQYRVKVHTYYRAGSREHTEDTVRGEATRERRMAQAWARRDAEAEAANPAAISWNGSLS